MLYHSRCLARRAPLLRTNIPFASFRLYSDSTTTPAPPLLLKLRNDLKVAMRAKDAPRLSVIRAVLAEVTNAAKTSNPVTTEMQLVSVLRKRIASAEAAVAEFRAAGREELVGKEKEQVHVLEEYVGSVDMLGDEELEGIVRGVVEETRAKEGQDVQLGKVVGRLFAKEGPLEGKNVDRAKATMLVKRLMS